MVTSVSALTQNDVDLELSRSLQHQSEIDAFMDAVIRDGRFILKYDLIPPQEVAEKMGFPLSPDAVQAVQQKPWVDHVRLAFERFADSIGIKVPYYHRDSFHAFHVCDSAFEFMVLVLLDGRYVSRGEDLGACEIAERLGLTVSTEVLTEIEGGSWAYLRHSTLERMHNEHVVFTASLEERMHMVPSADMGLLAAAVAIYAGGTWAIDCASEWSSGYHKSTITDTGLPPFAVDTSFEASSKL